MALDYFDRLAEASVKDAIQQLAANGTRPSARSVPPEARVLLSRKTRGRLNEADAEKRVQKAIERLKERKEIRAPKTPNSEWGVMGQAPTTPAES
jgi:hypothetical protein